VLNHVRVQRRFNKLSGYFASRYGRRRDYEKLKDTRETAMIGFTTPSLSLPSLTEDKETPLDILYFGLERFEEALPSEPTCLVQRRFF